jgi:hypothetical protein
LMENLMFRPALTCDWLMTICKFIHVLKCAYECVHQYMPVLRVYYFLEWVLTYLWFRVLCYLLCVHSSYLEVYECYNNITS